MDRYYYHVTEEYWGDRKVLKPRSIGCNRDISELNIPRICVAPSIEQCLIAIYISRKYDYCVYRTLNPISDCDIKNPIRISDAYITEEKWIIKKTTFIYLGNISNEAKSFGDFECLLGDGSRKSENWQKRTLKKLREISDKILEKD